MTRSAASTTARVGAVPPLLPTTPAQSGWVSGRLPWPLMLVTTAAPSNSASAASSPSAPEITTPPPQMKIGALRLGDPLGRGIDRIGIGRGAR